MRAITEKQAVMGSSRQGSACREESPELKAF